MFAHFVVNKKGNNVWTFLSSSDTRLKEDAKRKSNIGHLVNGCYNLPVASGALAVIVLQWT